MGDILFLHLPALELPATLDALIATTASLKNSSP
jgi:hypothetical protein